MNRDLLLMATLIAMQGPQPIRIRPTFDREPEWPKCLLCGKPKTHNNSFCSAECCKKYKAGERRVEKE